MKHICKNFIERTNREWYAFQVRKEYILGDTDWQTRSDELLSAKL